MRLFTRLLVLGVLLSGALGPSVQADEAKQIIGAAYDPALDGNGTYRGFPTRFDGRYPRGMPPGEGWKVLSGDGWLATSKCIGSFESPECMVDTVLACELWSDVHVDREYREGEYVRRGKWHPICGKLEYVNAHAETMFHWRHTYRSGSWYPQHRIVYYKTKSFIESYSIDRSKDDCIWYGICPGDTVVAVLRLDCQPSTIENPFNSADSHRFDYPDDAPISYCQRSTTELALAARERSDGKGWKFRILFNSGWNGTGYRGWPLLEQIIQSMR